MKLFCHFVPAYAFIAIASAYESDLEKTEKRLRPASKRYQGAILEEDVVFWTNFKRNLEGMSIPVAPPVEEGSSSSPVASPTTPDSSSFIPTPFATPTLTGNIRTLSPSISTTTSITGADGNTTSSFPTSISSELVNETLSPTFIGSVLSTGAGSDSSSFTPTTISSVISTGAGSDSSSLMTTDTATTTPDFVSLTLSPTSGLSTSAFVCPDAAFVGCTAPDPNDAQDECPTVGEPCPNGNPGEFCCKDDCPRNYCTAKSAPPMLKSFTVPLPDGI